MEEAIPDRTSGQRGGGERRLGQTKTLQTYHHERNCQGKRNNDDDNNEHGNNNNDTIDILMVMIAVMMIMIKEKMMIIIVMRIMIKVTISIGKSWKKS